MSHNPSPDWYARHQAGETYTSIAKTAHVSRSRVAGAISRYRDQLENPKSEQKPRPATPKPTPKQPRAAKRQAVAPEALSRFDEASAARTCLWIDGDLRDGHTAVCGMRRSGRNYCADHQARVYDQRPRKPVNAP